MLLAQHLDQAKLRAAIIRIAPQVFMEDGFRLGA